MAFIPTRYFHCHDSKFCDSDHWIGSPEVNDPVTTIAGPQEIRYDQYGNPFLVQRKIHIRNPAPVRIPVHPVHPVHHIHHVVARSCAAPRPHVDPSPRVTVAVPDPRQSSGSVSVTVSNVSGSMDPVSVTIHDPRSRSSDPVSVTVSGTTPRLGKGPHDYMQNGQWYRMSDAEIRNNMMGLRSSNHRQGF
jgi:hypothetical protein